MKKPTPRPKPPKPGEIGYPMSRFEIACWAIFIAGIGLVGLVAILTR